MRVVGRRRSEHRRRGRRLERGEQRRDVRDRRVGLLRLGLRGKRRRRDRRGVLQRGRLLVEVPEERRRRMQDRRPHGDGTLKGHRDQDHVFRGERFLLPQRLEVGDRTVHLELPETEGDQVAVPGRGAPPEDHLPGCIGRSRIRALVPAFVVIAADQGGGPLGPGLRLGRRFEHRLGGRSVSRDRLLRIHGASPEHAATDEGRKHSSHEGLRCRGGAARAALASGEPRGSCAGCLRAAGVCRSVASAFGPLQPRRGRAEARGSGAPPRRARTSAPRTAGFRLRAATSKRWPSW